MYQGLLINTSVHGRARPTAELLWGCDARDHGFWQWHPEALEFPGIKVVVRGVVPNRETWARLKQLNDAGREGDQAQRPQPPPGHGGARGHQPRPRHRARQQRLAQILSVIHHTGASTVLLLGVSMKPGRAHGNYPDGSNEPTYAASVIPPFATFVRPLREAGVAVLNCSPGQRPAILRAG